MASYTRTNAWLNGGTFANTALLWYARGVGVMQSRALDDPGSWWFFAAIHGQAIDLDEFPGWGYLPGPPQVPTTPLPSQDLQDRFWDQCQHQTWYFPPWHRGYLIALEAHLRAAVIELGGPTDWALPYWNYLASGDEYKIPPAFMEPQLPDGSSNPLFVKARYGPNMDGDIFVEIPPLSAVCQSNTVYTGTNAVTLLPGYGGPDTGFNHNSGISGNLEANPHNIVHNDVGGLNSTQTVWGLMSDPDMAALDPIFYIHHCNIDRMWAGWNSTGNRNPDDPNWLRGPAAVGDREFAMPMPDGSAWVYTPADVQDLARLDYGYDDSSTGLLPISTSQKLVERLVRLGATAAGAKAAAEQSVHGTAMKTELVGATQTALRITSAGTSARVDLDSTARARVMGSLAEAAAANLPGQLYLRLENVRGNMDGYKLNVSVNQQNAGSISLFGLRKASMQDRAHGAAGLTFVLDITHIVDDLFLQDRIDADALDVRIVPNQAVPEEARITVERVSIYRQEQ